MTAPTRLPIALMAATLLVGAPETLVAQWPLLTPDGGASGTTYKLINSTNQSVIFLATNLLTSRTYSFSVSCSSPVTSCVMTRGSSVTNTTSANWPVTFNTTGTVGQGQITLTVTGNGGSDQGFFIVKNRLANSVAVTPDGGTAPNRAQNTGGYSETFTVTNTGINNNTFTFSCTGTNGVTCGTVPASQLINGQDGSAQVPMPYSVGAPGTGTLTLTASAAGASDPGSYSVPIIAYGVSVTPDGSTAATRLANTGGFSESFTVTNLGATSNTFSFSCSGANGVVCGTPPGSLTLAPHNQTGDHTTVTMPYSVTTGGPGTLTLTASGTNATDAGFYSVPIDCTTCFAPSKVSGSAFVKDSRYILQETANTYNNHGEITQFTDARGKVTNYLWSATPTDAFLTKVTRVADAPAIDLVTDITYDGDGNVSSIKDEGGSFRYFTYDLFGRLRQLQNNAHTPVKAYGYTYSRTSPNWTFDPANPNAVVDSTFMRQTPTVQAVVSTGYLDGLGRPVQTVVQDGTNYHVTATQYDLMGRTWRVWKPYTRQNVAGFDPNATSLTGGATVWYNTYHTPTTTVPYVETAYTADALSRVKQVTPEHLVGAPSAVVVRTYGIDATNKWHYMLTTDEASKSTRSVTDLFGNVVRSILGATTPESTLTQFTYNVLGQRLQTTDPMGLITSYVFNTRGLQTSRTSPDAGTLSLAYDKAGNLRFTQDANQAAATPSPQVYFTSYDFAGRPLRSGLGAATFSSLNPDITEVIESDANCAANCLVIRQYDTKPPTGVFPWNHFSAQITPALVMNNLAGRLAAVASKSNNAWQATLFSYDADGSIVRRYIFTEANGGNSVLTAVNTSVTDSLDLRGAILRRADTVGTNYFFYQWYDYNGRGLLAKLYASTTNPNAKPTTPDDTDSYRPSGLPQGYQFQGSVFVPIRYTIREQTERIGDPAGTAFPFSARYAYQLNGVVDTAEFYSGGSPVQKHYRWTFGTAAYDALNRVKKADYSFWNVSSWTATPNYGLAAITYYLSGNLKTLQRKNETGTLIDNLTYNYVAGTNRLGSLSEAAGVTSTIPWDAEAGSFGYDANGNVTSAPGPYSIPISGVIYDPANLPLSITTASGTTTFRYDHAGQRITKQKTGQDTQVYLRDGGTVLGVIKVNGSGTATAAYFNVLWQGRVIGRQTLLPIPATRTYDHFDALGSVRSVVSITGTPQESYDYEPWGLLMPGRTLTTATPTKEGFTGKEQDAETGLDYFGARYYMPALGRWAAVDPLTDDTPEWSPYTYVLNNPLGHTDPDGRQALPNRRWQRLERPTPEPRAPARDPARFFAERPVRPGMAAGAVARTATFDLGGGGPENAVFGISAVAPVPPLPLVNLGASLDYSKRDGAEMAAIVSFGGAGIDLSAGLLTDSRPQEADLEMDVSTTFPAGTLPFGIGGSRGFARINGEWQNTDNRAVISFPKAPVPQGAASIKLFDIPLPKPKPPAERERPSNFPGDAMPF